MRTRADDAALAALATLVATWPLTTLLATNEWVNQVIAVLLVVAGCGIAGRAVALRGWQVLTLQLIAATLTASNLYCRDYLWHGLPTVDAVLAAGELLTEAVHTIATNVAPAPTTPGLQLVVGGVLALVAVVVDYLAVTRRSPSLAGLPLLAIFLTSAANSGSALNPVYFLAAAAMWLLMVARQGTWLLRRWSTTVTSPVTLVRDSGDSLGVAGYAAIARSLGVGALLIAVALPVALPHLPTRFLLAGLGQSDSGEGGGGGSSVGFSQSLDLAADLASRSTAPVLRYRTSTSKPPPLRVSVSSTYANGRWPARPDRGLAQAVSQEPTVPPATGLSAQVPKRRHTMEVEDNNLKAPNLAAPYPLAGGDLRGARWGLDDRTEQVVVRSRPRSYRVEFWQIEPTRDMLEAGGEPDPPVGEPRSYQVDLLAGETVRELAATVTAGRTTPYDRAMAIQEYLRSTGGFTYSLTLAPQTRPDPISNFLATKKGYCVQFATAMVMMSRASGIPARMATGFLPGTPRDGVWTVIAADAHAWPELYLLGIGWTRFEPTPAGRSGLPPSYAVPVADPLVPGGGATTGPGATASPSVAPRDPTLDTRPDLLNQLDGAQQTSVTGRLFRGWGLVIVAAVLGLAGSLVVPLAARWRRRFRLRTARTDAETVEAQWRSLTSRLRDLGMPPAPGQTPRQLRDFYEREACLDAESCAALGRVVHTLERARYAPPSAGGHLSIEPDARGLVNALARTRPRRVRLRAAVWPSSGVEQVSLAARRLRWRLADPWRELLARARQELSRRRRQHP